MYGIKRTRSAVHKKKFIAIIRTSNTSMGLGAIFELVKELNKSCDSCNPEGAEVVKETVEYIINVMEEALGVKLKLENSCRQYNF